MNVSKISTGEDLYTISGDGDGFTCSTKTLLAVIQQGLAALGRDVVHADIDHLEDLERKATPKPWVPDGFEVISQEACPGKGECQVEDCAYDGSPHEFVVALAEEDYNQSKEDDVHLIAALRNAAPDLFSELRSLREATDMADDLIKEAHAECVALRAQNEKAEKGYQAHLAMGCMASVGYVQEECNRLKEMLSKHWDHDVALWDEAKAFCGGYCRTCKSDLSLSEVDGIRRVRGKR